MEDLEHVIDILLDKPISSTSEMRTLIEWILKNWAILREQVPTHLLEIEVAENALLEEGPFKEIYEMLRPNGTTSTNPFGEGDKAYLSSLEVACHMMTTLTPILLGLGSSLSKIDPDEVFASYDSQSLKVVYSVAAISWVKKNKEDSFTLKVPK